MDLSHDEFKEKKLLEKEVEKIDRDADSVIVEGVNDKQVLQKLGFNGKIFLSAERTVEDLAEDVERGSERTVILTDFDKHGKKANKEIRQELQARKIDVINSGRRDFGKQLTSTGRMTVEDVEPLFHSKFNKFAEAALDGLYLKP